MRSHRLLLLIAASSLLTCSRPAGGPRDPSGSDTDDEIVERTLPAHNDALVFPPPPSAPRHARGAAPTDIDRRGDDEALGAVSPQLGADRSSDASGQRFRIVFSQPMQRPPPPAPALRKSASRPPGSGTPAIPADPKTLRITPAVPGQARWLDAYTLEFVAARRLQPGARYTVELSDLESTSGEKLSGWKASLDARASVAGKLLTYVPQIGEPRV